MRRRPMLQTIPCRRGCGRMLSSLIRPIHGSASLHAQYAGICGNCLTAEERADMERRLFACALAKVAA